MIEGIQWQTVFRYNFITRCRLRRCFCSQFEAINCIHSILNDDLYNVPEEFVQ
jgi:hypothetical protein